MNKYKILWINKFLFQVIILSSPFTRAKLHFKLVKYNLFYFFSPNSFHQKLGHIIEKADMTT